MTTPNLLQIDIGHTDDIPGFAAGFHSHEHDDNHVPFWRSQGYDGVHLVGRGNKIVDRIGDRRLENTLMLGRNCGYVRLSNFEIMAGSRRAIFAGPDASDKPDLVPFTLDLQACDITADESTVWGIHSYACDLVVNRGTWRLEASNEHGAYSHGFYKHGARYNYLTVLGVGAEALKHTARPRTEYYPPGFDIASRAPHHEVDGMHPAVGARIHVYNCDIRNWHQAHSWRGGAGFVAQGAGADIFIYNSVFRARDGDYKPCVAVDDSGWEHFSPQGIGGEAPANGHIHIERSLFHTAGRVHEWGNSWQPIMRFAQTSSDPARSTGPVARSLVIKDCGIYGNITRLEIATMPENRVHVIGCNGPNAQQQAIRYGVDHSQESRLQLFGDFNPISQGYEPSIS